MSPGFAKLLFKIVQILARNSSPSQPKTKVTNYGVCKIILQPRVAVVSLLVLLSYLLLPSPSQLDPQKSRQTLAVKSYSSQKVLYTREVKDTGDAEVDTKIVADKLEKVPINQLTNCASSTKNGNLGTK